MKIFKILLLTCLILIISGCKSGVNLVDSGMYLTHWPIKNPKILENIDAFYKQVNLPYLDKGAVYLIIDQPKKSYDDIDEYYMSYYLSLSSIYSYPISFYFMHDDRPVFVYFKKGPFVNPRNYPRETMVNVFAKALHDDWNRKYNREIDGYVQKDFFNSHPIFWKIKGAKIDTLGYHEIEEQRIIYGKKHFDYTLYDNLDNFRTDYSELYKTEEHD